MATNPYLTQTGPLSEKNLLKDLYAETIKFYGQDFFYIPRDTVNVDQLFGEDIASKFEEAYPLEMMVQDVDGYGGGDLFSKFGVEIRDEVSVMIAQHRFEEELTSTPHRNLKRPREGDLVFIPISNSLFEITFVEHESPFYIFNGLPAYKFSMALFEFSDQQINVNVVGLDIPDPDQTEGQGVESENYNQKLTLSSSGDWILGETITQTFNTSYTLSGEIVKIENNGSVLYVSHIKHNDTSDDFQLFGTGSITGLISGETGTITSQEETIQDYGANDIIETIADSVLVFDETNPFGEL